MHTSAERVVRVANALDHAVSILHAPMDHSLMVANVAHVTSEPSQFVAGILSAFRETHPAAKHDGAAFVYMGKPAVRWRWHAMPPSASQARTQGDPVIRPLHTPEPATAPLWGSQEHFAAVRAEMEAGDFTRAPELAAARDGFASVAAWQEHRDLALMLEPGEPEATQND